MLKIRLRQVGRLEARDFHASMLIEKSLRQGLDSVLKPLSLPADYGLALAELPVEQLIGVRL